MTDFEKFFADEFQRRLAAATVPGMTDPSWDRRAAWLLWVAENRHVFTMPISQDPATLLQVAAVIVQRDKPGVFD